VLEIPPALIQRRQDSGERLSELKGAFAAMLLREERFPSVTVYATGSLGRNEIGPSSDLDVFLVDTAAEEHDRLRNLQRIQLLSDLIKAAESARFGSFSRDGEFLVVHPLDELVSALGTRDDDYSNVFTARMLLLLESQPLLGDAAYVAAVERVLDLYWRDCDDPDSFWPTFLINDIVRYWKTLCLSYEGQRHATEGAHDISHLDLLKLKFNRVWMCFNGLAYILHGFRDNNVSRDHVRRLVSLTPLQRIEEIAAANPEATPAINELLEHYAWFLTVTSVEKQVAVEFFRDQTNYNNGRERGSAFGDAVGRLVDAVAVKTPLQRYLLI
jgi:predicted nucleotidyltransferase